MRIFTIAGRVVRQVLRDRRSLALLFIAPLFVLFLLYTFLSSASITPRMQAVDLPPALVTALSQEAQVTQAADLEYALTMLRSRETDAVITFQESTVTAYVEGTDMSVTGAVRQALATAVSAYVKTSTQEEIQTQWAALLQKVVPVGHAASTEAAFSLTISDTGLEIQYLNSSVDATSFDSIAPMLMGFFIFFFVFLLAGVAFLRERTSGTLERLLATRLHRREIVLGYFFGFGVFVFLQTVMIQLYMAYVLQVPMKGDFLLVMLINLLLAASSLSLGTLLSAFARNEFQMLQFIPIVIVPQVLFCGFLSLRGAPEWVVLLSKIFPLTYASDALTEVAIRGQGVSAVLLQLAVLCGYTVVFLALNTLVLRKFRRI